MLHGPASSLAIAVGLLATLLQAPPVVPSVDLLVASAPATFQQDGRTQLVYELHVTNFQPFDVVLSAVRVKTRGGTIAEYRDDQLRQRLVRPGFRNDHATPQILGAGLRAVINFWIELPDAIPASVSNEVELSVQRPAGAVHTTVERALSLNAIVRPAMLDAPLRDGPWIAIYDPLLKGGHRTAIYTIDGRARIPGRFAIDFVKLPPTGALPLLADRATANGFGAAVIAVADGTIVAAQDGEPDNATQPVPAERASGNYVALDLGSGRVAFYEHLQRGSLVVSAGQHVRRGQVIAKLGASGSTSIGPHLHFHVADANSLLGAEGLPFAFNVFTTLGHFTSIQAVQSGEPWRTLPAPRGSASMRPGPNAVVNFP